MGDAHLDADLPELSAIVLCYRAGAGILLVAQPLYDLLEQEGVPFELILVANQWPDEEDHTAVIAEDFARFHPHVRPVVREKQGAMGWDMRSGFEAAQGRYMIVIDGDAQNPVSDVVEMYRRMRESDADVMKGRRTSRGDGVYRRVVSAAYNLLFRVLFGTRAIWDVNGKPKGLSRRAYDQFDLRSDDWFIDAEIVLEAQRKGLPIAEMPVLFHRNDERASFVRVSAIWEFLVHMARYRLRGTP
jgi:glycosyltransferase involved in cell wall biosynthesis